MASWKDARPLAAALFVAAAVAGSHAPRALAGEAADKKAAKVNGTFESFADGKLTLNVKGKKGDAPTKKEFKIAEDTKVTVLDGTEKKELTAKDAFKEVKANTPVVVTLGEGDKVVSIQLGKAKKNKQ